MRYLILIPGLAAAACGDGSIGPPGGQVEALKTVEIADGLTNPLHLTAPPGDNRVFVVEQAGRIRIIEDGVLLAEPFLDLSASVNFVDEGGLLGLAFDPQYATTGRFWVHYTDVADGGAVVVERYDVSEDPDIADPASATEVLRVDKPNFHHTGGQLEFGPDGMLYISIGDGGEYEDPQGHAQNPGTLLGSILRIDARAAGPYAVPQDNPFSQGGGRPEVWAYGLRNPWRFSIDAVDELMFITDVGQHEWEEINAVPAGAAPVNFGWNVMEGSHCFNADTHDTDELTAPILEYSHSVGCSVIGGTCTVLENQRRARLGARFVCLMVYVIACALADGAISGTGFAGNPRDTALGVVALAIVVQIIHWFAVRSYFTTRDLVRRSS